MTSAVRRKCNRKRPSIRNMIIRSRDLTTIVGSNRQVSRRSKLLRLTDTRALRPTHPVSPQRPPDVTHWHCVTRRTLADAIRLEAADDCRGSVYQNTRPKPLDNTVSEKTPTVLSQWLSKPDTKKNVFFQVLQPHLRRPASRSKLTLFRDAWLEIDDVIARFKQRRAFGAHCVVMVTLRRN